MSVRSQARGQVYVINDGTDEVGVMGYKPKGNDTVMHEEPDNEEVFEEQTWVMVYGHEKLTGNDFRMAAFAIRPILDHNEIMYHFANCIQQHLYFTKGPLRAKPVVNASAPRPSVGSDVFTGTPQQQMMGGGGGQAASEKTDDIFEALKQLFISHNSELHMDEIYSCLEEDFAKKKIREAVTTMASNGQIYMGSSDDSYVWSG